MKTKIKVLIVDDHSMVRLCLMEAIGSTSDLAVAGQAINGGQAIEKYRQLKPDVVLMDYEMPGMNGAECAIRLREEFPAARIILLSIFEGEEDIWRADRAGAMGYLPKSLEVTEITDAIRKVARGETCFPPAIMAKLDERRNRGDLTPRELEVLRLVVSGHSNKEISSILKVSDSLVRAYVSKVLTKLGVADRTQAAVKAIRRGLVHLES